MSIVNSIMNYFQNNNKPPQGENGPFTNINDRSDRAIEMERFFDEIDPNYIINAINVFRKEDMKTMTQEQLSFMISTIIPRNVITRGTLSANAPLYRARNFYYDGKDQSVFYKNKSEIWYPKPEYLKSLGRLNNIGQPMLYTSFDARTPIYEIRSQPNTQFALIKYRIKSNESLDLAEIVTEPSEYVKFFEKKYIKYTKNGERNWDIISKFILDEFTRKVPQGKDYMYRTTIEIAKKFDFPGCDGFIYPSIEGGVAHNVVIKPNAVDRALKFDGLAFLLNSSYRGGKMKKGDVSTWQRWAAFIDGNEIIYAPTSPCGIEFDGLNKPIVDEINYYVPSK